MKLQTRRLLVLLLGIVCLACFAVGTAHAETIARCGAGWLEEIDGQLVLHLKGTPAEMGTQHGALLREHIRANFKYLVEVKGATPVKLGPLTLYPRAAIETISRHQQPYVPQHYKEELAALAEAVELPLADVEMANFLPELFHCSGFALLGSATSAGTLYHGRVLDYSCDWQLQEHAVLIVAEPAGKLPLVNVSYAGFIGSVTGMNAKGVSIGEMGGGGFGHWDGMPMALFVREVLETAADLDAAIAVMRDKPRTCEYYYVLADGPQGRAVGMEASWNKFTVVEPGEAHPLLPKAVKDCVLLSAGNRYEELVRRAQQGAGSFDAQQALRLMDLGVATRSNLHNVLFEPRAGKLWVAHASREGQPAATQPYLEFNLHELLRRKPDERAPELPGSASAAGAARR